MNSRFIIITITQFLLFLNCYALHISMSGSKNKVVILGGGFGGLYTAIKTSKNFPQLDITLVDNKDKFVFLPLLYELLTDLASTEEVAPDFNSLLRNTNIKFIQGSVNSVAFDDKSLDYTDPSGLKSSVTYDQLVVALGSQAYMNIPGSDVNATPFYTVSDAYKLKLKLRSVISKAEATGSDLVRIAVIGGGYSGVETAVSLAEFVGKNKAVISIIDRNENIMHTSPESNRIAAERSLLDNGISINTNTDVLEVTQNGVNLKNKKTGEDFFCPSDLVVFTAGLKPSVIVGELNLPKDMFGRIKVTRTLQTLKYPEVFALGDCAMVENVSLPSTAQVAMQQSEIVASNLGLRYNHLVNSNSEPKSYMLSKYSYVPLGSMLSLGAKNAAINSLDDNLKLDGLPASVGRRLVYSFRMPTQNQQFTALVSTVSSIIGKSLKKN